MNVDVKASNVTLWASVIDDDRSVGAAEGASLHRQRLDDAHSVGVVLMEGQAERDPIKMAEIAELSKTEQGGPIREAAVEQNARLFEAIDNIIDDTGGVVTSPEELGFSISESLSNSYAEQKAKINAAYNKANNSPEADLHVRLEELARYINQNESAAEAVKILKVAANHAFQIGAFVVSKKNTWHSQSTEGIPIRDAENLRKAIGNSTNSNNNAEVYHANKMKELIDKAVENKGGTPLYDKARALRRELATDFTTRALINQVLSKRDGGVERKVSIEGLFDLLISSERSDLESVVHLHKLLLADTRDNYRGSRIWNDIQAAVIDKVAQAAESNWVRDQEGTAIFSYAKFNKSIDKLNKGGKLNYILGPHAADKLKMVGRVAGYLQPVPNFVNTSSTASTLIKSLGEAARNIPLAGGAAASFFKLVYDPVQSAAQKRKINQIVNKYKNYSPENYKDYMIQKRSMVSNPREAGGQLNMFHRTTGTFNMPLLSAIGKGNRKLDPDTKYHPGKALKIISRYPGVNRQMIDYFGLGDWLRTETRNVTGQEVRKFLEDGGAFIHVTEGSGMNITSDSRVTLPSGEAVPRSLPDEGGLRFHRVGSPEADAIIKAAGRGETKVLQELVLQGHEVSPHNQLRDEYMEFVLSIGGAPKYTGGHYRVPPLTEGTKAEVNNAVHFRVLFRNTGETNDVPTLHIEEIQSDWSQSLAKSEREGRTPYLGQIKAKTPYHGVGAYTTLAVGHIMKLAAERGVQRIAWNTPETHIDRGGRESGHEAFYGKTVPDVIKRMAKKYGYKGDVYKTKVNVTPRALGLGDSNTELPTPFYKSIYDYVLQRLPPRYSEVTHKKSGRTVKHIASKVDRYASLAFKDGGYAQDPDDVNLMMDSMVAVVDLLKSLTKRGRQNVRWLWNTPGYDVMYNIDENGDLSIPPWQWAIGDNLKKFVVPLHLANQVARAKLNYNPRRDGYDKPDFYKAKDMADKMATELRMLEGEKYLKKVIQYVRLLEKSKAHVHDGVNDAVQTVIHHSILDIIDNEADMFSSRVNEFAKKAARDLYIINKIAYYEAMKEARGTILPVEPGVPRGFLSQRLKDMYRNYTHQFNRLADDRNDADVTDRYGSRIADYSAMVEPMFITGSDVGIAGTRSDNRDALGKPIEYRNAEIMARGSIKLNAIDFTPEMAKNISSVLEKDPGQVNAMSRIGNRWANPFDDHRNEITDIDKFMEASGVDPVTAKAVAKQRDDTWAAIRGNDGKADREMGLATPDRPIPMMHAMSFIYDTLHKKDPARPYIAKVMKVLSKDPRSMEVELQVNSPNIMDMNADMADTIQGLSSHDPNPSGTRTTVSILDDPMDSVHYRATMHPVDVLLHEATHIATMYPIDALTHYMQGYTTSMDVEKLTDRDIHNIAHQSGWNVDQIEAAVELVKIYQEVLGRVGNVVDSNIHSGWSPIKTHDQAFATLESMGLAYGISNPAEFIAEAFGNNAFRNWLKGQEWIASGRSRSLWHNIKDFVAGIFNVTKDRNYFDRIMELVPRLHVSVDQLDAAAARRRDMGVPQNVINQPSRRYAPYDPGVEVDRVGGDENVVPEWVETEDPNHYRNTETGRTMLPVYENHTDERIANQSPELRKFIETNMRRFLRKWELEYGKIYSRSASKHYGFQTGEAERLAEVYERYWSNALYAQTRPEAARWFTEMSDILMKLKRLRTSRMGRPRKDEV